MADAYDVKEIEKKWQARWRDEGTYEVDADDPRPPCYVLCMYPYPCGPAHMGHVRNYTFGDLLVRHRTMQGYAVLSPFGFDSFGLPAENAAIKTGTHPRLFTDARIAELKESISGWAPSTTGAGRSAATTRSTSAGTSRSSSASWRPAWPTARRRRSTGARGARPCWPTSRSWPTAPVSVPATWSCKRDLEQWFFRITDYADELLDDLDDLDWPERVKTMQRNWIGRSEGAEFDLRGGRRADDGRLAIRVFTTRPDTSFGMTYVVLAPEHPLVDALTTPASGPAVEAFVAEVSTHSDVERMSSRGPGRQARGVHRLLRDQPVHRRAGAGLPGRLRAHGLRHRRDHGRARRGPARLGLRRGLRAAHRPHRPAPRRLGRARPTPATARRSTASGSTGWRWPRP